MDYIYQVFFPKIHKVGEFVNDTSQSLTPMQSMKI